MNIGICTMTQNQGNRIEEWVLYHYSIGHKKFIFFLDFCTDNSEKVLTQLKNSGFDIDIHKTENFSENIQNLDWIVRSHQMYTKAIVEYSYLDWISFIEIDEFIYPQKENFDFITFLKSLKSKCLYINSWDFKPPFDENKKILGQSDLVWSDKQRYESEYKWRGKSIIKPKEFEYCVDAHHFCQKNGNVSHEFKVPHNNYIQVSYGDEVTIDDTVVRLYHFRNHTPVHMNDYIKVKL